MTTVVILLLGAAAVLIISAIESNPDGSDVSVLQTIQDIWNDKLNFQQGNTPSSTNSSSGKAGSNSAGAVPHRIPIILSNTAATEQIQKSNF